MDTAEFFLKGLIVGFLVAAPVGPVAVMCLHRTIAHGRLAAYVCGLGAAMADTIIGVAAALGLGFVADLLLEHQGWMRLIGGMILCALGLKLILARHLSSRAERQEKAEERSERLAQAEDGLATEAHLGNFAAAFTVMITNPITFLSFAALFAAIDVTGVAEQTRWGLSLTAGVFLGGAVWWLLLIMISGLFRHKIDENGILWVNRCSGAIIMVCGILLLAYPGSLPGSHAPVPVPTEQIIPS